MKTLKKFLVLAMTAVMLMGCFTASAAETPEGLIGYWNFDGNVTNQVTGVDASVTGTLVQNAALVPNPFYEGNTLNLNSMYGLLLDCKPTSDNMTVSIDIQMDAITACQSIVFVNSGYDAEDWYSFGHGWNPTFIPGCWSHEMTNNAYHDSWATDALETGKFYNLTWVIEGTTLTLYVDGVKTEVGGDIAAAVQAVVNEKTIVALGTNRWDNSIKAKVDSLAIYDKSLSADEVSALVAADNNPYAAAPVAPAVPKDGEVNFVAVAALAAVCAVAGIVVIDRKKLAK